MSFEQFTAVIRALFHEPFVKRDRVKDFLASFEKMRSSHQQK
jgi:hypothetical protein